MVLDKELEAAYQKYCNRHEVGDPICNLDRDSWYQCYGLDFFKLHCLAGNLADIKYVLLHPGITKEQYLKDRSPGRGLPLTPAQAWPFPTGNKPEYQEVDVKPRAAPPALTPIQAWPFPNVQPPGTPVTPTMTSRRPQRRTAVSRPPLTVVEDDENVLAGDIDLTPPFATSTEDVGPRPYKTTKTDKRGTEISYENLTLDPKDPLKFVEDLKNAIVASIDDENYDEDPYQFPANFKLTITLQDVNIDIESEVPLSPAELKAAEARYVKTQEASKKKAEKKRKDDLAALKKLAEAYPDHAKAFVA